MQTLNLRLIFLTFFAFTGALAGMVPYVSAQEEMVASPAVAVSAVSLGEKASEESKKPVFIELFSSQACVFCPQADRLFSDLLDQNDVFGVSCHVDYFKVREGSFAKPFCTERQNYYVDTLKAGPNYTPQMVINGHYDVVGYKMDDVVETLGIATEEDDGFFMLNIVPDVEKGVYNFILPAMELAAGQSAHIWLMVYDRVHSITVADGRNRGKPMDYRRIVSAIEDLGPWDGSAVSRNIIPVAGEGQRGFVVVVQDEKKGSVLAFGDYKFPQKPKPPVYGPMRP